MNTKLKILLAEDDDNLGLLLHTFLIAKGFSVDLLKNGKLAYQSFMQKKYDFCLLDVMMPEMDGFTLAKEIREIDKKIPILFLTAKSMKEDKLEGFSIGADDYMTKPFAMEELLARIEAIIRRSDIQVELEEFMIGKLSYNSKTRILTSHLNEVKLTTKENQLLNLLVKNQNTVLDRQAALRAIWGDDNYFNGRSMDVYIAKLRKILKDDENIEIMNVHGKGFQMLIKNDIAS